MYTKLADSGADLPAAATGHNAVRVDHPLLREPVIWTAHHSPKRLGWKAAKKWAEGLDTNGWQWRLPTVEEAFLLCDRSKYPALDVNFFPDYEREWIWTSTPAKAPAGYAWDVYLGDGNSYRVHQDNEFFVRAVRAGQ